MEWPGGPTGAPTRGISLYLKFDEVYKSGWFERRDITGVKQRTGSEMAINWVGKP